MLHGRDMSSPTLPAATPPTTELKTGAVIKRLLRDYVSGEWGLLRSEERRVGKECSS